MTNYEKHNKDITEKFQGSSIAFDKSKNKIVKCADITCKDCAFYDKYYDCKLNAMKWAASEYKEPGIDWSKVAIDTPVLVSNDGEEWERRYFSRVNCYGTVFVFVRGTTSWSSDGHEALYQYVKLAEVE
nr:MAG TPA: hypothetical protein [Caudoviricetes sp.]